MTLRAGIVVAMSVSLAASVPASAKDLVFGSWAPVNHGSNHALEPLFKTVAESTKGALTFSSCRAAARQSAQHGPFLA